MILCQILSEESEQTDENTDLLEYGLDTRFSSFVLGMSLLFPNSGSATKWQHATASFPASLCPLFAETMAQRERRNVTDTDPSKLHFSLD